MNDNQFDKTWFSRYIKKRRNYINKKRWISFWYQLDETLALEPKTVLELGPGPGIFKMMIANFQISIKTVDINPKINPDYIASATNLPIKDQSFDCICAFQMLEHLPYNDSLKVFSEMVRVTKKNIVISLPDAKNLYVFSIHAPIIGQRYYWIPSRTIHKLGKDHYWEVNKERYSLNKILSDFYRNNVMLKKTYRIKENSRHRIFVFEKI